jgi:hypothetical protein
MDIQEEVELRDSNPQPQCELEMCDGSGSIRVANGPDDFDHEFCPCPIGEKLQDADADRYDPDEYPLAAMVQGWAEKFRATCEANGFFINEAVI